MELAGSWIAIGYPAGDYNLNATYRLIPGKRENGSEIIFELFELNHNTSKINHDFKARLHG